MYVCLHFSIRKLAETGVLAYLLTTWERRKPECIKSGLDVEPVDIRHFSSAMYVLVFGFALAFIAFLFEKLHYRYYLYNKTNLCYVQSKK